MNRLQFGPLAMLDRVRENAGTQSTSTTKTTPTGSADRRHHDSDVATGEPSVPPPAGASPLASVMGLLDQRHAVVHFNLLIPMHYEPNYSYPLLVYFHDQRQDESQIHRRMPSISCRNYASVSLRSPGARNTDSAWCQSDDVIEQSFAALTHVIGKSRDRLNINPEKIFLVGEGSGGTMALRLAFQFPYRVAGVASLNGALPSSQTPLSRLLEAREIPVFWSHYRKSERFAEQSLCEGLSLLHTAGFQMTLRQYPTDDSGCQQVYSDLNHWLMEQVTGTANPS